MSIVFGVLLVCSARYGRQETNLSRLAPIALVRCLSLACKVSYFLSKALSEDVSGFIVIKWKGAKKCKSVCVY